MEIEYQTITNPIPILPVLLNPEKFVNYLAFTNEQLEDGNLMVRLKLLSLYPKTEDLINKAYLLIWLKIKRFQILQNRGKKSFFIVELVSINQRIALKDKKITSNLDILITNWFQTLARVLTKKEQIYLPFWTTQSTEISKQLWLPTETDWQELVSKSLNISAKQTEPSPPCWIKRKSNLNQFDVQKTYCLSLPSSTPVKWEGDVIVKNIQIPIKITSKKVSHALKNWFGTARYVYNKGIKEIKNQEKPFPGFYSLRDKLITAKYEDGTINKTLMDWEKEVPKTIRMESLRDACKNFSNNVKKVKEKEIKSFDLKFKSRKRDKFASIVINKESVKIRGNQIFLFKNSLKEPIGKIGKRSLKKWFNDDQKLLNSWGRNSDVRLVTDSKTFWLNFPIKSKQVENHGKGIIALDPGVRSFQVGFSEREIVEFNDRRKCLVFKLRKKLDNLQRLRSKKEISMSCFKRHYSRYQKKLENRVNDLHWQSINYLVKNYSGIILPHFESQKMRVNKISKHVNRNLDYLRHYRFKMRLKEKCIENKVQLYLVDESYTSKTCGNCGWVKNNLYASKIFKCSKCECIFNRDVNGARNILIKNLKKKQKIRLQIKVSK